MTRGKKGDRKGEKQDDYLKNMEISGNQVSPLQFSSEEGPAESSEHMESSSVYVGLG
jgi:hypothetical protein